MKKFILLLALTAVLSAQYTEEDLAMMGNGDYMDLMSMYGDHSTKDGMLMGGELNGEMIYGASREEDLGFGKWLKKKVFNKKNLKKAGQFAGNLAKKELERRINNGELSEEELMSMYGDHSTKDGMLMGGELNGEMIYGASREEDLGFGREEDLGFGKWLKKKVFNKKNLKKAGQFAGNLAKKELERRINNGQLSEEELMSMYGDHSTKDGMLMGGELNGQMIFGAGRE